MSGFPQGRKSLKITLPAARFGLISPNLAIPKQVRNDGAHIFVTLNLIQGRRGVKITLPAARFGLIYFNLAIPNLVRNDILMMMFLPVPVPDSRAVSGNKIKKRQRRLNPF